MQAIKYCSPISIRSWSGACVFDEIKPEFQAAMEGAREYH